MLAVAREKLAAGRRPLLLATIALRTALQRLLLLAAIVPLPVSLLFLPVLGPLPGRGLLPPSVVPFPAAERFPIGLQTEF